MNASIVPSHPKYYSIVCRQISRESRATWNRLLSILHDAYFVKHLVQSLKYPVVANLRCGVWYCPDASEYCYFKSTDGHQGNWSFSLSRLNLHLLDLIATNEGVIIVDATRKGKLFPDSLSKTIPIWIAVLNHVLKLDSVLSIYEGISLSEFHCIEEKLSRWKHALLEMELDFDILKQKFEKPMRPVWISQDTVQDMTAFVDQELPVLNFYPVFLVSCSSNQKLTPFEISGFSHESFEYVPGAADDEESWSMGLTSAQFWKHSQELISHGPIHLEDYIVQLLKEEKNSVAEYEGDCFMIQRTRIVKCSVSSLKYLENIAWIDCGCSRTKMNPKSIKSVDPSRYLCAAIPHQKKDKTGLIKQLPNILPFVSNALSHGLTVVLHDQENGDICFCILIATVIAFYAKSDDGSFIFGKSSHEEITKLTICKIVASLATFISFQYPSRGNLKQIFNYFHKGCLLGLKQ